MSKMAQIKLAVAGALLVCTVSGATAADLFRSDPQQVTYGNKRQEFGTGWYLRGDVSWTRDNTSSFFGDARFGDGRARNIAAATIGFGYKLNSWFRTDLTLDWRATQNITRVSSAFACPINILGVNDPVTAAPVGITPVENSCQAGESVRLRRTALLANGYFDLGTWAGVTPYIGAGAGVAYGRINGSYGWNDLTAGTPYSANLVPPPGFPLVWVDPAGNPIVRNYAFGPQNPASAIAQKRFNFAFALMTGFTYAISPNAKLDFGYRYLNMGKWGRSSAANSAHDFRIGVNYMID